MRECDVAHGVTARSLARGTPLPYCTEFEDPPVGLFRACPTWIAVTHCW
jgi:hypothetical protein